MKTYFSPNKCLHVTIFSMSESKLSIVHDRQTGNLIWQMPDGSFVQDAEGNFLCLAARRDDSRKREIMTEYVRKHFGITTGRAFWVPNRQVTDEEYQEQLARAYWGLTPDPMDDLIEDVRSGKRRI